MAYVPKDLLDRIQDLEREVRQLRGRAEIRPAMNKVNHGAVQIGEGGTLFVDAPNGEQILGVGFFANGRYGLNVSREDDGSTALQIGGNSLDTKQMVRILPRGSGEPIVMDDAYADDYLGRPWVPIPMSARHDFTNDSWVTTHAGRYRAQHAVLITEYSLFVPSGTTAEARVQLNKGGTLTQLGPTITASGGETFAYERITPAVHGLAWGEDASLLLEARRTGGTGACTVFCFGMWGDNSHNPDEA